MKARPLLMLAGWWLVLAACAPHSAVTASRPPARPAATAAPSVPIPEAPSACRLLPVVHDDDPGRLAGFLDLASGRLTADASARLTSLAGGELVRSGGSPSLVGWAVGWPYFTRAGRWVPAYPGWVSPDGTRYLYPSYQQAALRAVDVRTGRARVVASGRRLLPVQWTADGVYLMDWPDGGPAGLFLLSLPSGGLQSLETRIDEALPLRDGAAWESEVAAGVPTRSGANGPMANSLVRIDLATGRRSPWYAEAGSAVSLLGFATDGAPLVLAASATGTQLLRLTAPGRVADSSPVAIRHAAVTDRTGTWMIATDGTVLRYRPGSPPVPIVQGPPGLKPAGGCQP